MRRREFLAIAGGAAVAWPLTARGQDSERLRRVGVLIAVNEDNADARARVQAFQQQLKELGWIDGCNIRIEYRWSGSSAELLRASAAELVAIRGPMLFSAGNRTARSTLRSLHQSGAVLPIVFAQVADPLARGYVASIARPGRHITGFANHEHAIAAKWLELIREVAPATARLEIPFELANDGVNKYQAEIAKGMPPGMILLSSAVRTRSELDDAIKQVAAQPNGALIVLSGPLTAVHREAIISSAVSYRLPLIHPYQYFSAAGGLISYGPDLIDPYRHAAG